MDAPGLVSDRPPSDDSLVHWATLTALLKTVYNQLSKLYDICLGQMSPGPGLPAWRSLTKGELIVAVAYRGRLTYWRKETRH